MSLAIQLYSPPQVAADIQAAPKESWLKKTARKTWSVFKVVILIALGIALFISNPTFFPAFFFIGFSFGFVFNSQYKGAQRDAINQIKSLWQRQPWAVLLIGAAFALTAFVILPITLATASILFGASVGAKLRKPSP